MNTPTPRTDAATYPADCLGATLVTNRDCARELERELTAEREKSERYRLATLKLDAELATERARLDAGQILIKMPSERVWICGVDLRAAINAGMREDAK